MTLSQAAQLRMVIAMGVVFASATAFLVAPSRLPQLRVAKSHFQSLRPCCQATLRVPRSTAGVFSLAATTGGPVKNGGGVPDACVSRSPSPYLSTVEVFSIRRSMLKAEARLALKCLPQIRAYSLEHLYLAKRGGS